MATVDDKKIIFSMVGLNKTIQQNNKQVLKNIYLSFFYGAKIGIIGLNGSGKSTLLKIIAGLDKSYQGEVVFSPGYSVGYLAQEPYLDPTKTVKEIVMEGVQPIVDALAEYEEINQKFGLPEYYEDQDKMDKLFSRQAELQDIIDATDAWNLDSKLERAMDALRCPPEDQSVEHLSGGERRRVALCRLLLQKPDVLLLDEPTNHLDAESIDWLEQHLQQYEGTVIAVTHDRYFLDRVCSEIIEIDNKQIYSYKGNYSYYLEKRQERVEAMNADVERAKNLLRTELDWMRRQPQARGTKAKYRIDAFYELEKKAKQQRDTGKVNLDVKASYIGSKIFEAVNVSKRFGDLKITEDFNYIFARYEKMGIVGNNGTGKSTFIKMLMGEVAPDSGHFDVGETVRFGYYSQDGLKFDEQMKVIDVVQAIAEYVDLGNGQKMGVSQFLNYFLFTPEKQHSYVYKLSGGEKRRLYLCTVLMRSPNFLVLDEPTNDLDIVTLNVLEEYLRNFKGCAIVVSHDRYFMDKVVDHLLVFRGNADIKDFPGNYTQYRDWKDVQDQLEKEAEAALQARQNPAPEKPSRPVNEQKKKLTFKERKEFEALEEEIPALEAEKAELETAMSSGTLSTDELMAKSQRITQVMEEIDEKTMRWLELSELA